jgi:hypothetical protein
MKDQPWLRDPTEEEIVDLRKQRSGGNPDQDDITDLLIDHNGRPYWIKVVTREAPLEIWLKASGKLRTVRLD